VPRCNFGDMRTNLFGLGDNPQLLFNRPTLPPLARDDLDPPIASAYTISRMIAL
jgi:hypothetical protein